MIEFIYNEEERAAYGKKNLPEPKNVKQIGLPKEHKKIFVEDFVYTYLLQYGERLGQQLGMAVLLGKSERSGGKTYLYIKGAVPVEGVTEKLGIYDFSEKIWGKLYQNIEKYFPEQEILGWFLSRPGFETEKNEVIEETHRTYFAGAEKVLFLLEPLEKGTAFFGFDGNRFNKQSGYYIYYEKNEMMREFMLNQKEESRQAAGCEKKDVAMASFRKILKEKQEQKEKQKKKALSYGAKVAVVMIVFVAAVAWSNQLEKPTEVKVSSDNIMVEELPGDVKPQQMEQLPYTEEVQLEEETLPIEEVQLEEESQSEAVEQIETAPVHQEYMVQQGDTLAKISREFYGTDEKVAEICSLNQIADGDYIQVGETILLP